VGEWPYEGGWDRRLLLATPPADCLRGLLVDAAWSSSRCDMPGSYRAREAAPDMIKSPSAARKAMKKSGLRDAVDAPVRPQVRPHT
jgi:hypothetical protein